MMGHQGWSDEKLGCGRSQTEDVQASQKILGWRYAERVCDRIGK